MNLCIDELKIHELSTLRPNCLVTGKNQMIETYTNRFVQHCCTTYPKISKSGSVSDTFRPIEKFEITYDMKFKIDIININFARIFSNIPKFYKSQNFSSIHPITTKLIQIQFKLQKNALKKLPNRFSCQ